MDIKYINPFLKGINDIVNQVVGNNAHFEKPLIKKAPFNSEDLLVIIGFTGELNGKVLINFDRISCKNIASKMMGGMKVEYDEISKSAIGELCNMILGTSATIFSEEGININITSPTIIDGSGVIVSSKEQLLCIPVILSEDINFFVNISTKKVV